MINGKLIDAPQQAKPLLVVKALRFAVETVAQEGKVGGQLLGLRGTFACLPQEIPMHTPLIIEIEADNGTVYRQVGCAVIGLKIGTGEKGESMIEGFFGGGQYECMRPAGGGE
jgi:hypothetical protein